MDKPKRKTKERFELPLTESLFFFNTAKYSINLMIDFWCVNICSFTS